MKAVSLLQPWATLCMLGYNYKHHETRSWQTNHRGMLGIHASAGQPPAARLAAEQNQLIAAALKKHGLTFDTLPRGAMLGTVDIMAMHRITPEFAAGLTEMDRAAGDYTPGRWAWQMENSMPFLHPVDCRGALSIWEVPKEAKSEFIYAP